VNRGEKFDSDRLEWTKEAHIRQMYGVIYANMINARIAMKLPMEVFMDVSGNVVVLISGGLHFDIITQTGHLVSLAI
jgi:hypothetical protein